MNRLGTLIEVSDRINHFCSIHSIFFLFFSAPPFPLSLASGRGAGTDLGGQRRLLDQRHAREHVYQAFDAEHNGEGYQRADDACHGKGDGVAIGAGGPGSRPAVAVGARARRRACASARCDAADPAPVGRVADGELVHLRQKAGPGQESLLLAEQRVGLGRKLGGGAVGEQEADRDVVGARVALAADGGVGDELEGHRRGVVDYAREVVGNGGELGKAEEGGEDAISAELDVHGQLAVAGDGAVQRLDDLPRQRGARDGADLLGAVVGQAPLVLVGEKLQLTEGVGR